MNYRTELEKMTISDLRMICRDVGIKFLCTGFSMRGVLALKRSNNRHNSFSDSSVKLPSMESRNKELLKYTFSIFDNVFMSTGTSKFSEIKDLYKEAISLRSILSSFKYFNFTFKIAACNSSNLELNPMD